MTAGSAAASRQKNTESATCRPLRHQSNGASLSPSRVSDVSGVDIEDREQRLRYDMRQMRISYIVHQRPRDPVLTVGRVARLPAFRRCGSETGLAGWGAWIRTRGWRNQNPTISPLVSMRVLKEPRYPPLEASIGYVPFQNAPTEIPSPARAGRQRVRLLRPRADVSRAGRHSGWPRFCYLRTGR
jgi:hypothetical protein